MVVSAQSQQVITSLNEARTKRGGGSESESHKKTHRKRVSKHFLVV